ncbi:gamma-tubulin complex component 4 [Babesia caballi]|uniref:Gamma-tubulin complex component 4 n=1 Tax=Babesia caballi TaxID=5871 RepID=A0AAV4LVI9_BABCB|nr:gamma-tubulin complex component 4 [Babesia caballi]
MLHDVLMALAGHTGDIIVDSAETKVGFMVSNAFQGVSTSERGIINSVVRIGSQYRRVKQFVRSVRDAEHDFVVSALLGDLSGSISDNGFGSGVSCRRDTQPRETPGHVTAYRGYYVNAMCTGIDHYLEDYRANLVTVEKLVLADPTLPLSTLVLLMAEQKKVLEVLCEVLSLYEEAIERKVGANENPVLRVDEVLLMLQGATGGTTHRKVRKKLFSECAELFKRQLKSWICHGQLVDPHNEFLVCRRHIAPDFGNKRATHDTRLICIYEHFHQELSAEEAEFEWTFLFYLSVKKPVWTPCSYAAWKDILFMGKAARVLLRRYGVEKQLELQAADIFDNWEQLCTSQILFEGAIGRYRLWIAQMLWTYINEKHNMAAYIALFRHIYFLGYHDLFTEILERAWFTLQTPCHLASCTNLKLSVWNVVSQRLDGMQLTNFMDSHKSSFHIGDAESATDSPRSTGDICAFDLGRGTGTAGRLERPSFEFRQRKYYFHIAPRRFVLCGDAEWIDDEIVLNISKRRLEEPLSSSVEAGAVWFESLVHVANGFETGFKLELSQLEAAYMYSERKMRGKSLGRFCRFAIVVHSQLDPIRVRDATHTRISWELLRDSFVVEFTVDYDNIGPRDGEIDVQGRVYLGGKCASAFTSNRKMEPARERVLCVNEGETSFVLTDGGRHDFLFIARLKMTRTRLFVELEHVSSSKSLIMETDVMDTAHLVGHDFGDAYIGILSSPIPFSPVSAKVDLSKRNCAIRISRWDFAGCMAKYEMLPPDYTEGTVAHETFLTELPGLRLVDFESGLNDWMYSVVAYRCTWPASILFDLSTMLCYNSVFQFIFLIRTLRLDRRSSRNRRHSSDFCGFSGIHSRSRHVERVPLLLDVEPNQGEDHEATDDDENQLARQHRRVVHSNVVDQRVYAQRYAGSRGQVALHAAGVLDVDDPLNDDEEERNEPAEGSRYANAGHDARKRVVHGQEDVHDQRHDVEEIDHGHDAIPVDDPHEHERKDGRKRKHYAVELLGEGVVVVYHRESFLRERERYAVHNEHNGGNQHAGVYDVPPEAPRIPRTILDHFPLQVQLLGLRGHLRRHVRRNVLGEVVGENEHGDQQPRNVGHDDLYVDEARHVHIGNERDNPVHYGHVEAPSRETDGYHAHGHVLVRRPVASHGENGENDGVRRDATKYARRYHDGHVSREAPQHEPGEYTQQYPRDDAYLGAHEVHEHAHADARDKFRYAKHRQQAAQTLQLLVALHMVRWKVDGNLAFAGVLIDAQPNEHRHRRAPRVVVRAHEGDCGGVQPQAPRPAELHFEGVVNAWTACGTQTRRSLL